MRSSEESYSYVFFVDEAGDDGLRTVRPIDPNGGSEWLCVGGVLVRSAHETGVVEWVKEIRDEVRSRQGPALHYRNLSLHRRTRVCELLATQPCRIFVVASNKKNMRGHSNVRAAERGGKQWFYNYCVRLLMERVTDYCLKRSKQDSRVVQELKVIFSARGGHSYAQTKAYWEILKTQAAGSSTFLNKREIAYEVLRFDLVEYVPHAQVAGLQLADIVASSFYQAVDALGPNWAIEPAQNLEPRMARDGAIIADYGLVLQPTPPWRARLTAEQKRIFTYYGFDF